MDFMKHSLALLIATVALATIAPGARADTGPGVVSIGRGGDQVWLMRPNGPVRVIVVFVHGWSTSVPEDWAPWLHHLRARGVLVIYPRYESGTADTTQTALVNLRHDIVAAFGHLGGVHVPVVALGKSFGGAAVFDYAGEARAWGVPAPVAVVGIFPAYPTGPLPPALAPGVFAEVIVGDADTIAGTGGANTLWSWLRPHPAANKRYITIRSRPGFSATHESAQLATPIARAVFWHPFDVLLARVRAGTTP
jgi:acetyl esterase/lipase